ncbi:MAG: 4Fe-4S binding protein, partial [Desulfosarcina sp.]|nr:4Fe-4S binding protein [Desulfosarcina sp.]
VSLREIVFELGNGVPKKKKFKAVQTGGPSGGCIPERFLDLPVDFQRLAEVGSIMGSGGMIVMDQDTCMVDVARYFLDFLKEESCGQCNPCREGIKQMLDILTDICAGKGKAGDIELLEELGAMVQRFSLCGLGTAAPNPVLTTILYFRDEYEAHIQDKRCAAGVCKALFHYDVDTEACTGCGLCAKKCPQDAITGKKKEPHRLDQDKCIKCGICYDVCKFDAIAIR